MPKLLGIQQKEASRIINAAFCNKVDQDNSPLKCRVCEEYTEGECKGRPSL